MSHKVKFVTDSYQKLVKSCVVFLNVNSFLSHRHATYEPYKHIVTYTQIHKIHMCSHVLVCVIRLISQLICMHVCLCVRLSCRVAPLLCHFIPVVQIFHLLIFFRFFTEFCFCVCFFFVAVENEGRMSIDFSLPFSFIAPLFVSLDTHAMRFGCFSVENVKNKIEMAVVFVAKKDEHFHAKRKVPLAYR